MGEGVLLACLDIIGLHDMALTMQDSSCVLRSIRHFHFSTNGLLGTLEKVATELKSRMIQPGANVADFIRNLKIFSVKYVFDKELYDIYYQLLFESVVSKGSNGLSFVELSDALEALSAINYRPKEVRKFYKFLVRLSNQMMDKLRDRIFFTNNRIECIKCMIYFDP